MQHVSPILTRQTILDNPRQCYKIYTIKGKSGKRRQIEEPIESLMYLQKDINNHISTRVTLHPSCMAKSDSSIVHNSSVHENARHVLKVDIKSCYQNITRDKIARALGYQLSDIASYIAANLNYCVIPVNDPREYILPTGAPTSPTLCNVALTPIDYQLAELASKYRMKYTRYIDDMHFSTTEEQPYWPLITEVKKVLEEHGYHINRDKSKWLSVKKQDKIVVTGVRIAAQYKTPLEFYRKVRAMINNHLMEGNQDLSPEIRGCLAYIQQIDKNRYDYLLKYINRRQQYASARRTSAGSE